VIPTRAQSKLRLAEILARGSVNLGEGPDIERLMLMLTRSCELRCGYCFVQKIEGAQELSQADARRAVDLLMRSKRSRLELQLFGGEPTRSWPVLSDVIHYADAHPDRAGRVLEIVLTTNGLGLTAERIAVLESLPVMILFSLDGDARAHRRFRGAHLTDDDTAWTHVEAALERLKNSSVSWFMNSVIPPAAASEVYDRYVWAREQGVPRLQLNYAVGMRWKAKQEQAFLEGLVRVLRHHHENPDGILLFNWRSDCEPVMLSDDLIVDVDGTILHDGAIFLERAFAELKQTYRRGHLDTTELFDPLRWDLKTLFRVMAGSYPKGSDERRIIVQNCQLGAAVDWTIQTLRHQLGHEI
jgi:MoaA/NifB/PqqE/SkfB family radical SAM enzyme